MAVQIKNKFRFWLAFIFASTTDTHTLKMLYNKCKCIRNPLHLNTIHKFTIQKKNRISFAVFFRFGVTFTPFLNNISTLNRLDCSSVDYMKVMVRHRVDKIKVRYVLSYHVLPLSFPFLAHKHNSTKVLFGLTWPNTYREHSLHMYRFYFDNSCAGTPFVVDFTRWHKHSRYHFVLSV